MSACKLQNNGSLLAQDFASTSVWPRPINPCQTLRRHSALGKATASSTNLLAVDLERPTSHLGHAAINPWPAIDAASASTTGFTSHSGSGANGVVARLLISSQAAALQQLSAEILGLLTELDTELSSLLPPTNSLTLLRPYQRESPTQQPQLRHAPNTSTHETAGTSSAPLISRATTSQPHVTAASAGAASSAFDPLPLTTVSSPATRPAGLSLLSLSLPSGGPPVAASGGAAAGAGNRAERRRRKSQRLGPGAGAASSQGPEHEAKFKATGTGSLTILMGSFSKDRILTAEEEQLLASAAQDFMQLTDLSRVLGAVLKRNPSVAEVAKSLNCEEGALRVRMDSGNRARTLLAQKNYRLVVNIAKKLVRATGGTSGGPAAAAAAGGGGGAAGVVSGAPGGGSSVSSSLGDGGVSLDDAITVGMEALMHAIRKFKPEAGYRLSTYATWWIRLRVSRLVQAQGGVISMSLYHRAKLDRVRAARALLRAQLGPGAVPSTEQLAAATGLSVGQVVQLQVAEKALGGSARSFEGPVADGEGGRGLTVEDMVAQDADADMLEGPASSLFLDSEDFAASASLSAAVEALLASLDRGEAEVLRKQYGLGGEGGGGGGGGDASVEKEEEEENDEVEAGEGLKKKAGAVASGLGRLKLGRKSGGKSGGKSVTSRALEKLRQSAAAEEGQLAEWLHLGLGGPKTSSSSRPAAGYAKKSKG